MRRINVNSDDKQERKLIMPLIKGNKAKSKKGISENIKREIRANPGMNLKQAVAISYSVAGKSKKKKK